MNRRICIEAVKCGIIDGSNKRCELYAEFSHENEDYKFFLCPKHNGVYIGLSKISFVSTHSGVE